MKTLHKLQSKNGEWEYGKSQLPNISDKDFNEFMDGMSDYHVTEKCYNAYDEYLYNLFGKAWEYAYDWFEAMARNPWDVVPELNCTWTDHLKWLIKYGRAQYYYETDEKPRNVYLRTAKLHKCKLPYKNIAR